MMDRIQALGDALEIVAKARVAVYGKSPAAWEYLWHVTRYLTGQQNEAFSTAFSAADGEGSLSALASAISEADETLRSAKEAEAEFDAPVRRQLIV